MQASAAVLYEPGRGLTIEEVEVLPPRAGEVLVRYVASGVCRRIELKELNHAYELLERGEIRRSVVIYG